MIHITLLLVASLVSALAQAPPPSPFKPIEFAVGSCWTGAFPDGKQTDEHCFEWVFDKAFVRDRHVVRGGTPYQGETLYSWDASAKRLVFSYWNSAGQVMPGTVEETPAGVVFLQRLAGGNGPEEIRAVWTRTGADGYTVAVSQRSSGAWTPMWTMEFKRKK